MPRQRSDNERSWSLVPIMNLATLLIPVLLMGSQFIAMRVLDEGPEAIRVENPGDDRVQPVSLRIEITKQGFRILGAETVLAGPQGQPVLGCAADHCVNAGSYDYEGLARLVGHVKAAYPWADEIEIAANEWVPYEVLVRVNEAVRGEPENELFPRIRLVE